MEWVLQDGLLRQQHQTQAPQGMQRAGGRRYGVKVCGGTYRDLLALVALLDGTGERQGVEDGKGQASGSDCD